MGKDGDNGNESIVASCREYMIDDMYVFDIIVNTLSLIGN